MLHAEPFETHLLSAELCILFIYFLKGNCIGLEYHIILSKIHIIVIIKTKIIDQNKSCSNRNNSEKLREIYSPPSRSSGQRLTSGIRAWLIPCYVKHLLERWLPDLKGLIIELQFSTAKTTAIGRIACVSISMQLIGTSGQLLSMVHFRSP